MKEFLRQLDQRISQLQNIQPQLQAQLCETVGALREAENLKSLFMQQLAKEEMMSTGEHGDGKEKEVAQPVQKPEVDEKGKKKAVKK